MPRGLSSHQTATQATFDRSKTHRSIGQLLKLSCWGKVCGKLTAIRECQAMVGPELCGNGASKNHGLGHHHPRGTGLRDLHGQFTFTAANAPLRQIHQQGTTIDPPTAATLQQLMKLSKIRLFRRSEINQLISIVIRQPISGRDPAAQDSEVGNFPMLVEIDPGTPGGVATPGSEAEGTR